MRIVGRRLVGRDDITRPVIRAEVQAVDGTLIADIFLVDPGADGTVFSADLLKKLALPPTPTPSGTGLQGVSGGCGFVEVQTVVEFTRDDGGVAAMKGQFAAFTDPAASDLSILGRDILHHFDLILGRHHGEVLLLSPPHHYRVLPG
jgi:hypothetical protein